MRRALLTALFVTSGLALAGCATVRSPARSIARVSAADPMELYALNPDSRPGATDRTFQGRIVVGQTSITDVAERSRVIEVLREASWEWTGEPTVVSACKPRPHHGLCVMHQGATLDFVLCFECGGSDAYVDDVRSSRFFVRPDAKPLLDDALRRAGLETAPE